MKAILTAAWAGVLFVTSLPAAAAQPPASKSFADVRHVKVDYSDLDLTKSRGLTTLQHRVSGAIARACDGLRLHAAAANGP
jgi:UrcA family protein